MKEGYLLISTGSERFVDRAAIAAMSIIARDGSRPICLACSPELYGHASSRYGKTFSEIVKIQRHGLLGTELHLFMDELSPYDRTIYMDSDCLVCSDRIQDLWDKLGWVHIGISGSERRAGRWRVDVEAVRDRYKITHVVQNNGGVVYFDRSPQSTEFFSVVRSLFHGENPLIKIKHISGGGVANEPIYATAMAICGIRPIPVNSGMNVSVRNIVNKRITDRGFWIEKKDSQRQSVIIAHFLGMEEPGYSMDIYNSVQYYNDKRILERSKQSPA